MRVMLLRKGLTVEVLKPHLLENQTTDEANEGAERQESEERCGETRWRCMFWIHVIWKYENGILVSLLSKCIFTCVLSVHSAYLGLNLCTAGWILTSVRGSICAP